MQKGGIACYYPRKKNMIQIWPLLYYICENTTFKCRIRLSKNRTRKPFNRNSRERKLFKSWYSIKDYENGGHCTRGNCKYNEGNLLYCVNTRGQFILLVSYQRLFSASRKRKGKKPPCPNGSIQSDGLSGSWELWSVPFCSTRLSGSSAHRLSQTLLSNEGCRGWLRAFMCNSSFREE
jgi:hypothetical protein